MKKAILISLSVATVLLILGLIITAVGLFTTGFDLSNMSTVKYIENTHEIDGNVSSISVNTTTADIIFKPSENDKFKIICHEQEKITHSVSVENGKLNIDVNDQRKWYEKIVIFSFGSMSITIYLPNETYEAMVLNTDTGDVEIPKQLSIGEISINSDTGDIFCDATVNNILNITSDTGDISISSSLATNASLKTDTGDIRLSEAKCETLVANSDTGTITLNDVTASISLQAESNTGDIGLSKTRCSTLVAISNTGKITLNGVIASISLRAESDTGDIKLEESDGKTIYLRTNTGDISGEILSEKIIFADSKTGKVDVPRYSSGGECTATSTTGDVRLTVKKS